jgi:hypothetical protein
VGEKVRIVTRTLSATSRFGSFKPKLEHPRPLLNG